MTDVVLAEPSLRLEPRAALSAAEYHRLAREIASHHGARLTPLRMAVLSSYSTTFLRPYLVVEGARRDFATELHFGAFNQFEQELVDAGSPLWAFGPDVVVIAMRPEDVDTDAVVRFHATAGSRFAALADAMLDRVEQCARAARARMTGPVFVASVATPSLTPLGPFDAGVPGSLTHAIADLNRRLAERVTTIPGTYVWDYAGLVRSRGVERWTDPRMWLLARAVVAPEHQGPLAAHLVRTVAGTLRTPAKCLVLDLDNTIWGGVIGDDGPGGIQLGDDYPGSAFKQFQRAALALIDRGVLLAVASKNNPEIVEETFRTHPEMVIRWDDLACVKANWRSKSENLREIARELNIGVDALVLFDDNPVERAEVRAALPNVGIVDVPTDPLQYVAALQACEYFDQPSLQAEDRDRAAMYRRDRERRSLEDQAASPEDFLRSLDMEADVGVADEQTIGRIAQLIGKTNQFNLTTRRHTQAEVAAMAGDGNHAVAWLRLRDRFGDQGLVVVGIVRRVGTVAEVDTFLMSCRVMNRRVEQAFMAYLLEHARALGCRTVRGEYLPTAKNGMVSDFYPGLGFEPDGDLAAGGRRYALDLGSRSVEWPDVIRRRRAGE
jgi:FkbH-like protein